MNLSNQYNQIPEGSVTPAGQLLQKYEKYFLIIQYMCLLVHMLFY